MKFISLLALLLSAKAGAAEACTLNEHNITTVLLNSAEQLTQLKAAYLRTGSAVSCREIGRELTEYTFAFRSCGNCEPKTASLIVTEDTSDTDRDGPVKYTYKLEIKKGRF